MRARRDSNDPQSMQVLASADDIRLSQDLANGDPLAFECFVRQYYAPALATARRILRNDAAASDCVQDAFLNAVEKIGTFEGRSSLATWLSRITVNRALMIMRRSKSRKETPLDDLLPEFDEYNCRIEPRLSLSRSVEDMIADAQLKEMVLSKIDELPDPYRLVLIMRDIEELSTADVAAFLDVSVGTVKTRLHRARAALKKLLEPIWLEHIR